MKKLLLFIYLLSAVAIFSSSNRERGNINYEDSFSSRGIDAFYSDLATEDLEISFHKSNRIELRIWGRAPKDNIEKYIDFGVNNGNFYIERTKRIVGLLNRYSITVSITLPESAIDLFNLKSATGDITLKDDLSGDSIKIETSTGDLYAKKLKADDIIVVTSTGTKEVDLIDCEDLTIKSSTGDNKIDYIRCDDGLLSGSTSKFYLGEIYGNYIIQTSTGDIDIYEFVSGDLKIGSSTGEVYIRVDKGRGYSVDLRSSTGDVSCNMPIEVFGKIKDNRLSGNINGGGDNIVVSTSTGDITIK